MCCCVIGVMNNFYLVEWKGLRLINQNSLSNTTRHYTTFQHYNTQFSYLAAPGCE